MMLAFKCPKEIIGLAIPKDSTLYEMEMTVVQRRLAALEMVIDDTPGAGGRLEQYIVSTEAIETRSCAEGCLLPAVRPPCASYKDLVTIEAFAEMADKLGECTSLEEIQQLKTEAQCARVSLVDLGAAARAADLDMYSARLAHTKD